jgi:hypothetical protein
VLRRSGRDRLQGFEIGVNIGNDENAH